ncbi:MAG: hypothetical protein O3C63_08240 [Cyanobacteria bacterium]|nr:hypothetical protein [Cyanobacteriota bacterium]
MVSTQPIKFVNPESQELSPGSAVQEKLPTTQTEELGRDITNDLELLHHKKVKTFGDIEAEQKKTLQYMLIDLRKIVHLVTSVVCGVTSFTSRLLPEQSKLKLALNTSSTWLAKLAIGVVSGASGAVDAFKDGKYLLGISQIGDAITTVLAPTKEITNYRGLWIGAYNALPALETIEGKSKYLNFNDNVQTTWRAFKQACSELKANPAAIFDRQRSGMLGLVTGALTSASSLMYMLTGAKAFASIRDAVGMGVELEKLKSIHYEAGRGRYIASGWTMLFGSAANMISKYAGKGQEFWSYLNLSANAIGKLFYLDALQNNEPARRQDPITLKEIFNNTLKESLNWGKETRASIERAQPIQIEAPKIAERIENIQEAQKEKARVARETSIRRPRASHSDGFSRTSAPSVTKANAKTAPSPKGTAAAKSTAAKSSSKAPKTSSPAKSGSGSSKTSETKLTIAFRPA